jgi:hypothetical protein
MARTKAYFFREFGFWGHLRSHEETYTYNQFQKEQPTPQEVIISNPKSARRNLSPPGSDL